jgi:hypothetical protein
MRILRALTLSALAIAALPAWAAQKTDAVVLVNSSSSNYADTQHFIRPYMDNFGIPYAIVDIAKTAIGPEVGNYSLIIIGHARLDPNHAYLSADEEGNLVNAILAGSGLINFDNDLSPDGSSGRYQFIQRIFGFSYSSATTGSGIAIRDNPAGHYITALHQAGDSYNTGNMRTAGIVLPYGTVPLATVQSNNQPLVAAAVKEQGRAVQWGSYDWMSYSILGPVRGLDDLVWRSMVWAARKPFVMRGMPSFVTMRVDDAVGNFSWVKTANDYQLIPWLGMFYRIISAGDAADLSNLVRGGFATAAVHAFSSDVFFYYDHWSQRNLPDATVAANLQDATAWLSANMIPSSKIVFPHFYEIGTNAFSGLLNWGVEFVGTLMNPGSPYGSAWLMSGPYRLFETGSSSGTQAVSYADYLTVPNHPELANTFFNTVTEIRDDAGYEWYPTDDVASTVAKGTRQLRRSLDSMVLATLFTHEYYIQRINPANWRSILAQITANLTSYNPIYVSLDYAAKYVRAKKNSKILTGDFNPSGGTVSIQLSGHTDIDTQVFLFQGTDTGITQSAMLVPPFSGSIQLAASVQSAPLSITTASLPTGVQNQPYHATLNASGGSAPYTWSLPAGALPSGLALNNNTGVISGIPVSEPGSFLFNAIVKDATGQVATRTFSIVISGVGSTIWPSTQVPGNPDHGADSAVEIGVRFQADFDGYITGVRFYKAVANTGTHIGSLWTAGGTLLSSAQFASETPSGWQQVNFSAPVPITANTVYVASYHTNVGHYSQDRNYFASSGVDRPPLHALPNRSGGNGVYAYSANSAFPSNTFQSSNYWVDVVFVLANPVKISAVAASSISNSSAVITWTTDRNSDSQVEYGPTASYGFTTTLDPGLVTSHAQTLSGLASGTLYHYGVRSRDAGGSLSISQDFTFTTGATSSIWPASALPAIASHSDSNAVELGVRFRSDADGFISAIRFFKGIDNTGLHVASLWTNSGVLLSRTAFSGETASGWQTVTLSPPVAISANTTYVASYHTNVGHYSITRPYFGSAYDHSPLHALADGFDGGNGVYAYSANSVFPSNTYQSTNYWVDVVFTPGNPVKISAVTASSISNSGAIITWTTDTNSDSQVEYGPTTSYGFSTTLATGLVTSHAQTLSGLASGTLYHYRVRSREAGGSLSISQDFTFTTKTASGCPCSIWPASTLPAIASHSDSNAVELGVRFRSDVNGFISAIKFFKGATNVGTHVASLWTSNGILLAQTTFVGETASGWQQVNFSQPVAVSAGTAYVASYHTNVGQYAVTRPYFTSAFDSPPLHALEGIYIYSAKSTFPINSYAYSNYWVDVVFTQ